MIVPNIYLDPSRSVLIVDFGSNPTAYAGAGPSIARDGGAAVALPGPIYFPSDGGCTWLLYMLPAPIGAAEVVTFSAAAGFASTAAGPAAAIDAAPVGWSGPNILPMIARATRTMGHGQNTIDCNGYQPAMFSNFAKMISPQRMTPTPTSFDADFYPLKAKSPTITMVWLLGSYPDLGGLGKGCNNYPQGLYRALLPGKSDLTFDIGQPTVATLPDGTREVVTYFGSATNYSPDVTITIHACGPADADGDYPYDLRGPNNADLRIYPPDPADPTGNTPWRGEIPEFYPPFMARLAGTKCLRAMGSVNANTASIRSIEHLPASSRIGYGSLPDTAGLGGKIARVTQYDPVAANDPWFATDQRILINVETETPHGFWDGLQVELYGLGRVATVDGQGVVISNDQPGQPTDYSIRVLDATHFVANVGTYQPPQQLAAPVVPAAGYALARVASGVVPFDAMMRMAAAIPGCAYWLNVPTLADDALATHLGDLAARTLPADRELWSEAGNEQWNLDFYGANMYAIGMGRTVLGITNPHDHQPWQFVRTIQVGRLIRAAFAAAGADPARVIPWIGPGPSADKLDQLFQLASGPAGVAARTGRASNPLFDALYAAGPVEFGGCGPAMYYSNQIGGDAQFDPIYANMTAAQLATFFELDMIRGPVAYYAGTYRAVVDKWCAPQGGRPAILPWRPRLAAYEGSPAKMIPNNVGRPDRDRVSTAAAKDPRMYRVHLHALAQLQDAGFSLYNHFFAQGGNAANDGEVWNMTTGYQMRPGTGDPAIDAVNLTNPWDLSAAGAKSEVWGAQIEWNLGLPTVVVPAQLLGGGLRAARLRRLCCA